MVSVDDAQIIELARGQRADAFRLDLLDADRAPLGISLNAHADNASMQVNTSRTTFRTVSGITVEDPPAGLDLRRTRVRPMLRLSNDSDYPLGVLMFGTDTRRKYTAGDVWTPELFDETFLLEQDLDRTVTLQAGQSVRGFFSGLAGEVLEPLGIPWDYSQVADVAAATPLSFRVGSPRLTALRALAALLSALPPFFDNAGVYTLKPAPVAGGQADHVYAANTRIVDGSSITTSQLHKAPNRYIVVGDGVRGVYNLPPAAPNSAFATGRVVTKTHIASGVTDPDLAAQIAYVDALTDDTTYETASFDAAADPRHGIFDTVEHLGVQYLETGHTLGFAVGANHAHSLTRMWA